MSRRFRDDCGKLVELDRRFARIVARVGRPRYWSREPGFGALVLLVLEQQVSLASAKATWDRLESRVKSVTPRRVQRLDVEALRELGFSRPKARYTLGIAEALLDGSLDLDAVADADDDEAERLLTGLPGIGPWTARAYLLSALRRRDVWPSGDLALAEAVRDLDGAAERPSHVELDAVAEAWRPRRSAAARLLWHHYLNPVQVAARSRSKASTKAASSGSRARQPGSTK